ncbi:AMP-binding protein [Planomonospora sp. ID91781]|uniref:AMP-dependent synthetase n=1 Tax=Planomonospora sphaerica TaxID=161355 RepID=A0A171DQC3_9ACTN|nr:MULTISPECIES: AMP-binding protein [Planomonospora]MBG0824998.1 AMP-binding protein [Planomonospora sp. ID91781]GAT71262.1 AMP-dependent synthetase [Planomonospora sphaerica]
MTETIGCGLHERFLRGLSGSPGRVAVRAGAETVSYEEAHRLALRWAGALLAAPAEPPRAVGVLAGKGIESYVGILAALYTGATVVPLNPDFPAVRTERMLRAAGASVVLADGRGLAALAETSLDLPVVAPGGDAGTRLRTVPVSGGDALDAPARVRADDVAYVLFTSGSTGRPKGVPITHGSTHHYFGLLDERYDFRPDDVFSQTFDLNFDCAMFDMFCAWGAGASVHPVPAQAYRDLPAFFAERGMTVWFSTPAGISVARKTGGLAPGAFPTLRWSFFAGEALRCADAADWQAAAPASAVENLYGPTELTVTVTGHRWSPETSADLGVNGLVPIGALHEGHDHLLLAEGGGFAEDEGELCVTGPQMTAGYLDPEDDDGRFLKHDGRAWYRTGDRVRRLADGELLYLGRLDSQVQIQGWRVELAEVEHEIRSCDGVEDAVAVTRPGPNGTELVVFYTGVPAPPVELARRLRRSLPKGMLPREYRHVGEFPLNSNRKVDRGRLAAEAAGRTPAVGG